MPAVQAGNLFVNLGQAASIALCCSCLCVEVELGADEIQHSGERRRKPCNGEGDEIALRAQPGHPALPRR